MKTGEQSQIKSVDLKKTGSIIRKLRFDNNITQQQLAYRLNMSRAMISCWESGQRIPNAMQYRALAEVFNVDVETLY